jgi:hypothetical protein
MKHLQYVEYLTEKKEPKNYDSVLRDISIVICYNYLPTVDEIQGLWNTKNREEFV